MQWGSMLGCASLHLSLYQYYRLLPIVKASRIDQRRETAGNGPSAYQCRLPMGSPMLNLASRSLYVFALTLMSN
jgi:hypothetical protein